MVDCATLGCPVLAAVCVARQKASDVQRTQDSHRGEASEYPSCVSERCAQGRGVRLALDPHAEVAWRGEGFGRRTSFRSRNKQALQNAARARLERAGLLEEVRTLDIDPDPVTPEEEEG